MGEEGDIYRGCCGLWRELGACTMAQTLGTLRLLRLLVGLVLINDVGFLFFIFLVLFIHKYGMTRVDTLLTPSGGGGGVVG